MIKGKLFELLAATAVMGGTVPSIPSAPPAPVAGIRSPAKEWNKRKKRRKMQSDSRKANR